MARYRYDLLVDEVRQLVADLRKRVPSTKPGFDRGFRQWAKTLHETSGYGHKNTWRHLQRIETDPTRPLTVDYVIAACIAEGVEIPLGANPRIVPVAVEGRTRDFLRSLRLASVNELTLTPADIRRLQDEVAKLERRVASLLAERDRLRAVG